MDLREQLQGALGSSYTLDRELGGGGMSRVFVAEEARLKRKVVVKVLSPELAQGISAERFEREMQLAASLQQANIVPVLSAGDMSGIPFYTMPFVEGESLRGRLRKGGALPIDEAISIIRDVARALAYAHERGIVHRDIKPDNVLLSGGAAVVTDFGIAKALSAARANMDAATLTQLGTAIGTPAYISPEQAAGDEVDHRADIYSLGCMAYELLAGQPPFTNRTPQRLMAAHMSETPQQLLELRPDAPTSLAAIVMRCLEKDPSLRPQSATELLGTIQSVVTSGAAFTPMPSILMGGRGMLKKALLAYAGAFIAVAIFAKAAIVGIGLPDWVFPGALIVMALGLPVILFTAYTQYVARRAVTTSPTFTPGGTPSLAHGTIATIAMKASPHMSWRRTMMGGVYAVAVFVALIGTYMLLRALGIGPVGSLIAKGALAKNERILIADFQSPASDTTLGPVITEAFRTNLAQSTAISVMTPIAIREVLRRMQRPITSRVDFALGREIATREGIKAVLDGSITSIGGRFLISARLVGTQSGEDLASFSESAASANDLLPAIDKLTRSVRSRIGESLRDVQAAAPLEQVTTSSLEALRKFVQGQRAQDIEGDFARAQALLEEAVSIDTTFAMAYRKLGILYNNRNDVARAMPLLQKAFDHRDRLSDAERYLTEGTYYMSGPKQDLAKAIAAYEALIEMQPTNEGALNNVGNLYGDARDFPKALAVYQRAVAVGGGRASVFYTNLALIHVALGHWDSAAAVLDTAARILPGNPDILTTRANMLFSHGQHDSALAIFRQLHDGAGTNVPIRASSAAGMWNVNMTRGRLAEARRWRDESERANLERGLASASLFAAISNALDRVEVANDTAGAERLLAAGLAKDPVEGIPPTARPYQGLVDAFSRIGKPVRARAYLAAFERDRAQVTRYFDEDVRHAMLGDIAVAEHRYDEAVREYRAGDKGLCVVCALPAIARAYDLGGQRDSAIAVYDRYVTTPYANRRGLDARALALTHKRLGELLEQKGDAQRAAQHYMQFVELWKNADPELQPRVAEVRRRLSRLADTERK